MRRIARISVGLAGFAVLALGAMLWLASSAVQRPAWYQHRGPELGMGPMDGDAVPAGGSREAQGQGARHDPGRDFGYAFEEVSFAAVDGSTLRGWLVPGAEAAQVAVVTVHGAGADRRDFLRHLPLLHEAGYPVLLFDCREHGISDGAARGVSLGIREHRDVSSAVDFLKREHGFPRVAVLGTSQGGASVILAAAADPSIDAVIAENPFTRIADLVRDSQQAAGAPLWLLDAVSSLAVWRMGGTGLPAPIDAVSRIAPRPLLLMHGSEDRVIPIAHSQRLHQRAGEPVELWVVPGARHARLVNLDADAWRERVVGFLARWLGPVGSAAGSAGPVGPAGPAGSAGSAGSASSALSAGSAGPVGREGLER